MSALHRSLAFVSTLAAIGLAAETAHAEVTLGAEARGELSSVGGELRGGPGLRLSAGYALDTYPILVAPELVFDGVPFFPDPIVGAFRAMAGARFGFTAVVEPYVFTHVGYGFLGTSATLVHGFAVDAGLGLDKRFGRHLTIGGSIGYQGFVGEVNAHGGAAGFHVVAWL